METEKWEYIGREYYRLRIPFGWIVERYIFKVSMGNTPMETREFVTVTAFYVFDPFKMWRPRATDNRT